MDYIGPGEFQNENFSNKWQVPYDYKSRRGNWKQKPLKTYKKSLINLSSNDLSFVSNFRCSPQWPDWKILCISDLATCGARGKDRTCTQISEGRAWHTNVTVCPGDVHASPVQHLPFTLSSDVYICNIRNELLHDSQITRNAGWSLQFPDVWSEHDPAVPDVNLSWMGRGPQWYHGWERLRTRSVYDQDGDSIFEFLVGLKLKRG